MGKIFLTSDWHLGETRMEIMQRPFADPSAMFVDIKKKHNAVVGKNDLVYVVGDAVSNAATDPDYWLNCISQLNGSKILVRGNHDARLTREQLDVAFDAVVPEGDGVELDVSDEEGTRHFLYATHYPTQGRLDRFNLVGHIHGAWKYQLNMLNLCVDVHNYSPIQITQVPFFIKAVTQFYDEDVFCANNPINKNYESRRGKKGTYFKSRQRAE